MSPIEIAAAIVSVLLLVSRFVQAAKPMWERLPKAIAVVLPPAVGLVSPVAELLNQTKTWSDLVAYLIAAFAMVLVGLFPKLTDAKAAEQQVDGKFSRSVDGTYPKSPDSRYKPDGQ